MWLSRQTAGWPQEDRLLEQGVVTIEGDKPGVLLTGERRDCHVARPAGISWSPALGSEVLTLTDAEGEVWVLGPALSELEPTEPGGFCLRSPWGSIKLCSGGVIIESPAGSFRLDGSGLTLTGDMKITGSVAVSGSMSLNGLPVAVVAPADEGGE